jgi:Antitoxin VbhA
MSSVLERISAPQRFKMSVIIKPIISDAERAERVVAVEYGRASVRLEGYIASPEYEELASRYVEGEFSHDQYVEKQIAASIARATAKTE